jgi:peptide/nickel transport system permease protein
MPLIHVFGTNKSLPLGVLIPVIWLLTLHLVVSGADFFSPYDYSEQKRSFPFAPPSNVRFSDDKGHLSWRPFVCRIVVDAERTTTYQEDCRERFPLRFFVKGSPYRLGSLTFHIRLFGVNEPGAIYLLGTDAYGRDQFSRFLHGGRVSLLGAVLACGLCLVISILVGTVAGFYGGWIDGFFMWSADLFLALPWLYLLFGVRAFLPLDMQPASAFIVIIAIIAVIGWPRPARLIRGIVLVGKEHEYVLAARSFGASDTYLLRRHIIPQVIRLVLTQASLLIPRFVLAEITLSFLGLGISEPAVSWGLMLSMLQNYYVLVSHSWMILPALFLVPTFYSYAAIAELIFKD